MKIEIGFYTGDAGWPDAQVTGIGGENVHVKFRRTHGFDEKSGIHDLEWLRGFFQRHNYQSKHSNFNSLYEKLSN